MSAHPFDFLFIMGIRLLVVLNDLVEVFVYHFSVKLVSMHGLQVPVVVVLLGHLRVSLLEGDSSEVVVSHWHLQEGRDVSELVLMQLGQRLVLREQGLAGLQALFHFNY